VKRAAGFSLVEVLCALLILSAGVVGITQSVTLSLRWSGEAERITRAQELAAGRIETLKATGYLTEGEEEGTFDEFPLYRYSQTIAETSPKGLYEVTVTVTLDRAAAEGEPEAEPLYELKTLVFEKPVVSSFDTDPRTESGRKNRRDERRGKGGGR
jgi:prepilin-type N-terminal cleavage/methylation domain-containing protein